MPAATHGTDDGGDHYGAVCALQLCPTIPTVQADLFCSRLAMVCAILEVLFNLLHTYTTSTGRGGAGNIGEDVTEPENETLPHLTSPVYTTGKVLSV